MTELREVTVAGIDYWAMKPEQLAQLLPTSKAMAIADPSGRPVDPDRIAPLSLPASWAASVRELWHALLFSNGTAAVAAGPTSRTARAVAPVPNRLVFTVEEAAQQLGFSRSSEYEAVQRGEIPFMRIRRRILVPEAALVRFLDKPVHDA